MTVTYRKDLTDIWREYAYLATRTVTGRLTLAFMLLFPIAGPAIFLFSTTPGSKAEHFAAAVFLPALGLTYVVLTFSVLIGGYLATLIMPKFTITLEPERCEMMYFRLFKTPWRSFQCMVEEPDFFYFLGWRRLIFIPKHTFASRDEADRFFHTALTYWHEAKGTVPPPSPPPLDLSGVWPPAPQAAESQEPGAAEAR